MAAVDSVHWGIDGLLSVAMAAGGWVVKNFRDDQKELREKHDDFVGEASRTFARRDDMKDMFDDIKQQQREMNAKLDRLIERR